MHEFDPYNQVPKLLKYIQDLVKIVNRLNKQMLSYSSTIPLSGHVFAPLQ